MTIVQQDGSEIQQAFESVSRLLTEGRQGDTQSIRTWSAGYRNAALAAETALSGYVGGAGQASIFATAGARERRRMMHLIEPIENYLKTLPRGEVLSLLDVDCGFGHGTALLSSLFQSTALGYRLRVLGIERNEKNATYAAANAIRYHIARRKPEDSADAYDLVTSCFSLQRQSDPIRYAAQMCALARKRVFVLAPYEEPSASLIKTHRVSIDGRLLGALQAQNIHIRPSPAWGNGRDDYKVVSFELEGQAD